MRTHGTCRAALLLGWTGLLLACAAPVERVETGRPGCLSISLARDFRMLDEQNLVVYAPWPHHVQLSPGCAALPARHRIGLSARGDQLCGFAGDAVILNGAFPERCPVLRVERLDDEGLEELLWRFEGREPAAGGQQVEIPRIEED
jgi:hypothetical protein